MFNDFIDTIRRKYLIEFTVIAGLQWTSPFQFESARIVLFFWHYSSETVWSTDRWLESTLEYFVYWIFFLVLSDGDWSACVVSSLVWGRLDYKHLRILKLLKFVRNSVVSCIGCFCVSWALFLMSLNKFVLAITCRIFCFHQHHVC